MQTKKNINMKQLLPLFLFLLPCLAWAQYPSNGNQKITLGEQTTADGLIYRGVLADTGIITPLSDTSAYIILDTVNHRFYNYNRATNVWSMAGVGSISSGLTGTLPVANGGTGSTTLAGANIITGSGTINYLPKFTSARVLGNSRLMENDSNQIGFPTLGQFAFYTEPNYTFRYNGVTLPYFGLASAIENVGIQNAGLFFSSYQQIKFFTNNIFRVIIANNGDLGINTDNPTEKLHVVGNARFEAVGAGAYANDLNITSTGVLTTASSDEKYKYNILPINYGLNTILQLNPVNFQWIKGEENDLGFIAQDVAEIIPEAVDTNWNSDLLMRYESIIPILTKAIQEQNSLIKALEQRIINLENK
jgi:hypothetical protein